MRIRTGYSVGTMVTRISHAVTLYNKPDLVLSLRFFAAAILLGTLAIVLISTLQAYQIVRYTILSIKQSRMARTAF